MAERWKRPDSVAMPSVWATIKGKRPMKNGKIPRFRIQDITPELEDESIQHMLQFFLYDEPYCAVLGVASDEAAKLELVQIWKDVLQHRIGLVALLDNAEELEDSALPRIAGCNMTFASFPEDKDPELKNQKILSILTFVNEVSHRVNCFEKYNADVMMYALGLSVAPVFRGQGLGEELLRARFTMGKAVGIKLTTTVFTGPTSQALARKVGFELISEMKPEEYLEDGVVVFQNVKSKSIQSMAATI